MQVLQYQGNRQLGSDIQKGIENVLDFNNDGKFDEKDIEFAKDKTIQIVNRNIPASGGFLFGVLLGFLF